MLKLSQFQRTCCQNQARFLHSVYTITPETKCQEQENQACYLTKTVVKRQLPQPCVHLSQEDRQHIQEAVKQCIINTNHFHQHNKPQLKKRDKKALREFKMKLWRGGLSHQLMINMLRAVDSVPSAAGIGPRSMTHETILAAPWERLGKKIQVAGRHGHLISGKKLLPLFAEQDEVDSTRGVDMAWDDLISPFFDLHQQQTKFVPESGFHPDSPFPCPQTLIAINSPLWKSRFNTGQGVFLSFAHALNHAISRGEQMGEDLVNPVPIQCMVFNGRFFDFVCYQLNTLDFSEDNGGRKNMAWICSEQQLYDSVMEKSFDLVLEDNGEQGKVVEDIKEPEESVEQPVPALLKDDSQDFISKRVSLTEFNRKRLSDTFSNEMGVQVSIEGFNRDVVDLFTDFVMRPGIRNVEIEDSEEDNSGVVYGSV